MRCRGCSWPTPLSALDLLTRRCHVCCRLKRKFKGLKAKELQSQAQNLRAAEELDHGRQIEDVLNVWTSCGKDRNDATALVNALVAQRQQRIGRLRDEYHLANDASDDTVIRHVAMMQRAEVRKSGLYALAFGVVSVVIPVVLIVIEENSRMEAQRLRDPMLRIHFGCFPFLWLLVGVPVTLFSILQIITGRKEFAKANSKVLGLRS